jgi:hypothetical protein
MTYVIFLIIKMPPKMRSFVGIITSVNRCNNNLVTHDDQTWHSLLKGLKRIDSIDFQNTLSLL